MDQYSINIIGNNGTVNADFVENNYKLALNEILLGQASNFPIKKDITDTIGFGDNIIKGMQFKEQEFIIYPGTPQYFDLKAYIEDVFDEGTSVYNSAVSFYFDLYFKFNHFYDDTSGGSEPIQYHYAGMAHKKGAFVIYKPNKSGVQYISSDITWIQQDGLWVQYDSSSSMYGSIIEGDGHLSDSAFNTTIVNSSASFLKMMIDNKLNIESGFSAYPSYKVNAVLRLRAFEYSLDDHSIEEIK